MIPSLVEGEIRRALVDYLTTTFGLSDDDVRESLEAFLTDADTGIFRGPYLRVRTPFRAVDSSWASPLGWLPEWFVPYVHQATAFERLSTVAGHVPRPTLVTTGTGSGKTECFSMPVLDHCARMRDIGQRGIKAIILYPMNALASDQAGRLAELISSEPRLAGIRAGIYVGENGEHAEMGADHLIDDRFALRDDPPDILLTNYKMLDFLLLRREDRPLWATTGPDTLRYVVLDEFHTYDGAQGTDVAMLLRRLGATLGTADERGPLGAAAPVATSATLGSDPAALVDLRDFAGKVFGVDFEPDSVIGETRQGIAESCLPTDPALPVPDPAELDALPAGDMDALAAAFCRRHDDEPVLSDPVELGERLLAHPVTRAVLAAVADRPRVLDDAAIDVAEKVTAWSGSDPALVREALRRFLALLSIARRPVGGRERPLFAIETQLWIREVTRLMRLVQPEPRFAWLDTPSVSAERSADVAEDRADTIDGADPTSPTAATGSVAVPTPVGDELPAVWCRRCGHSGWMTVVSDQSGALNWNATAVYDAAVRRSPMTRVMLRSHPDDEGARFLDPVSRTLLDGPVEGAVPVRVTEDEDQAKHQNCPSCGERDAVRFVGLAVASLASVAISTMFGSDNVGADERKLLAFTDSVQDASHRASFFVGRTHRFNTRALIAGALRDAGDDGLSVADIGDLLVDSADTAHRRHELVPPDLLADPAVRTVWSDQPDPVGLEVLRQRVGFEVDLEFGLRSRVGRTLEQSVAAAGWVDLGDDAGDLMREVLADVLGDVPEHAEAGVAAYLLGVADRLRHSGAILNPLVEPFVDEGGAQWFIWGGRPIGLPPFTPEQSRPTFVTTATTTTFDSLTARHTTPTWWVDWAARSLGLGPAEAVAVNLRTMSTLAGATDAVISRPTVGGHTAYGLDRRAVRAVDIAEVNGAPATAVMRCDHCGSAMTVPPGLVEAWTAVPCRRYRCVGHLHPSAARDSGYYRRFYRQGTTRRVVTGEHTGLLRRADREALETAFKDGTAPDAPNVLTATPTLEMGIDIGDLSAVMLTSVPRNPASYIQRVGRAGRATGNSLVTTFVRGDTHGLYYLSEPEAMLAGAVRPPNCYLEASETLHRQYVAYLMDRIAEGTITANPLPNRIGELMRAASDDGGLFQVLTHASMSDPHHVEAFLALFGDRIGPAAANRLREFAAGGIEPHLKAIKDDWHEQLKTLERRRDRLRDAIRRLEELPALDDDDDGALASLRGQRSAVIRLLREHRDEYPLSALERLGLLPNYTLTGDTVSLSATLWSAPRDDDGEFTSSTVRYDRPGIRAIAEFAPGNTFYVDGHRHRIDAVEIGAANEPLYEMWRVCPSCTYADIEVADQPLNGCPRCGDPAIADLGAQHRVLRLRSSFAAASEDAARVFDESDDRTRERYEMVTLIDPDPGEIRDAWLLQDRTFGAEFVGRARLRTFNLGIEGRHGEQVNIAGQTRQVPRFTVCGHCGAVADVRDDRQGTQPQRLHQGWCKVRSGSLPDQWDPLVLVHELTTEAIRVLVPVSMFEVDERLATFKGALLLGIREMLGGDPDHLTIATADAPNVGGQGRRRFLVIYDTVPGGTGYLGPLAEPDKIKEILVAARDVIAHCRCRHEGRAACHRCLLGVVGRNEYDLVRRDLARDLLDEMLEEPFEPTAVATVSEADIAGVEESELERRFKVALRHWAENERDAEVTLTKVPGRGRHEAFELTIGFGGDIVRYKISEQAGLSDAASTLPDFLVERMDAPDPAIAVYLDGYQFHASAATNRIADDARKRAEVRATGRLVWSLSWHDVERFHDAVTADPPKAPPDRALLTPEGMLKAKGIRHDRGGEIRVVAVDQNPMALLLDYLVYPQRDAWRSAVQAAVGGMAASAGIHYLDAAGLATELDAAQAGDWVEPPPPPIGSPVAVAARAHTPGQLPLALFLDLADPDDERWTVLSVLDDSPAAVDDGTVHRSRWSDWVAWSNLLQFLGPPEAERAGITAATSQAESLDWDDLWLRGVATAGNEPASATAGAPDGGPTVDEMALEAAGDSVATAELTAVELSEEILEELDLVLDDDAATLARSVLERGAPLFVAGYELNGIPIEVAWPDSRVAVITSNDAPVDGWDARSAEKWTVEELLAALDTALDGAGPGAASPGAPQR